MAGDPPSPAAGEAATCRDFVAGLPETVIDLERRDVEGGDGLVAAWGDPAVVLTCGVAEPEAFTRTSTCIEANGTGWFVPDEVLLADDESIDVTMTAVGVRPRVRVEVPGDYRPGGFQGVSGALGRIVADELRMVSRCG